MTTEAELNARTIQMVTDLKVEQDRFQRVFLDDPEGMDGEEGKRAYQVYCAIKHYRMHNQPWTAIVEGGPYCEARGVTEEDAIANLKARYKETFGGEPNWDFVEVKRISSEPVITTTKESRWWELEGSKQ